MDIEYLSDPVSVWTAALALRSIQLFPVAELKMREDCQLIFYHFQPKSCSYLQLYSYKLLAFSNLR